MVCFPRLPTRSAEHGSRTRMHGPAALSGTKDPHEVQAHTEVGASWAYQREGEKTSTSRLKFPSLCLYQLRLAMFVVYVLDRELSVISER